MYRKVIAEKKLMSYDDRCDDTLQICKVNAPNQYNKFILTIKDYDGYWDLPYSYNNENIKTLGSWYIHFSIEDVKEFLCEYDESFWIEGKKIIHNTEDHESTIDGKKMYGMAENAQKNYAKSSSGERDLADFLDKLQEIKWDNLLCRFEKDNLLSCIEYHINGK